MIQFQGKDPLRFQSLGDGNCAYNTEAVWLIYAYQQGLLEPLLKDKEVLINFARLFTIVADQEKNLEISSILREPTSENIKQTFDTFIQYCTSNDKIDWVKLQKILARALRTAVVDAIRNHPTVRQQVIKDLNMYIGEMIEDVYKVGREVNDKLALYLLVNSFLDDFVKIPDDSNGTKEQTEKEFCQEIQNILVKSQVLNPKIVGQVYDELSRNVAATLKNAKEEKISALQEKVLTGLRQLLEKNISEAMDPYLPIPAHFEGMLTIKARILSIPQDSLDTKEEIRQTFLKWFFEGDELGFKEYINNIGQDGVNAGALELKVLSVLFAHAINLWSVEHLNKDNQRTIDGFRLDDEHRVMEEPERHLIFDMEKMRAHWNILFPDNDITQQMVQDNDLQRIEYARTVFDADTRSLTKQILKKYGSFPYHNGTKLKDLSPKEYCQIFNITLEEYNQSARKLILENGIPEKPPEDPEETPVRPPIPENPPVDPTEVPPDTIPEEIPSPPPAKPTDPAKGRIPPSHVPQQRDWFNYLAMMWTFTAALALLTYGAIWPLWFPMMTFLFEQTALAPFIYPLSMGIVTLFCVGISAVFTEKMHVDWETEQSSEDPEEEPSIEMKDLAWVFQFLSRFIQPNQEAQQDQKKASRTFLSNFERKQAKNEAQTQNNNNENILRKGISSQG